MPSLQKLLAGLIVFSPAVYAIATPDQAEAGKVRGFTGPADQKPRSDYLTGTFCYCAWPEQQEEVMGPAHYYQFDYYNRHHDTTFVLTSTCPDGDIDFDIPCAPTDHKHVLVGDTMRKKCKRWKGWESSPKHPSWNPAPREDELCYLPQDKHDEDYISFNGQYRSLGKRGGQGMVVQKEAGICDDLCQENLGMPMLKDPKFMSSHQVVWNDVDDMCEWCK